MKKILIFLIIFLTCKTLFCSIDVFQLTDKIENSDFNHNNIREIDSLKLIGSLNIDSYLYEKGNFDIYIFTRVFKGEAKNGKIMEFTEKIFVKVSEEFIVESYYIPYSWNEPPIKNVILYSNKKIKLKNILLIEELNYINITENGINILKDGIIQFTKP